MQFKLEVSRPISDMRRIEDAVRALDPAAVLDSDVAGINLRVASALGVEELLQVVTNAGYAIEHSCIVAVPSECCGGCGG